MEQTNNPQPRHIKSFWAITVVLVVALLAAGLVYWFQFQFSYDQEINSLEIKLQRRIPAQESVGAKSQQKTPPTAATSTK